MAVPVPVILAAIQAAAAVYGAIKSDKDKGGGGGGGGSMPSPAPSLGEIMASLGRPQGQAQAPALAQRSTGVSQPAGEESIEELVLRILTEGRMPTRPGASPLAF